MKTVPQSVTTALLYIRVSSDEQAREGLSLDAQLAECRRYAAQQGWLIGAEYQDVLSGTRDDRPQYQALLAEVRRLRAAGTRVVVVVAALDRFGRKLMERVRCREELTQLGVPVHSVREGGEVSDLVANVLAAVAQEEVRRLSERIKAVRQHIGAKGWHAVGRAPWGYLWRDATPQDRAQGSPRKVLDVDEITAPYAREAFRRAAGGQTVRAVHRWLMGLPSAARGDRVMTFRAVRVILSAAVYVGRLDDDKPGRWPALVDEATFRRVQERIASHALVPRQASGEYLLTGFARCYKCGGRMVGRAPRKQRASYRCSGPTKGANAPDTNCCAQVTAPPIDAAVLGEVAELVGVIASVEGPLLAAMRRAWARMQQPDGTADAARRVQQLEQAVERARARMRKAGEYLLDGTLDKATYADLCEKQLADIRAAEAELERLGSRQLPPALPPLDEVLRDVNGWDDVLTGADVPAAREVLAALIERLTPVRLGPDRYGAEITWTPLGEALHQLVAAAGADAA